MNIYRRQTQMRLVSEDEVARTVKARYRYQVEDKASLLNEKYFPLQSFGSTSLLLSFRSQVPKQIPALARKADPILEFQEENQTGLISWTNCWI